MTRRLRNRGRATTGADAAETSAQPRSPSTDEGEAEPVAMPADVVTSAQPRAPSADEGEAEPVAMPADVVDSDGVWGALVDTPFLADMGDGMKNLILVDWEIPPQSEVYLCGRITVPEDVYFNETQPVNPLGTHHTVASLRETPNAPDGVRKCDTSEVGRRSIGGSGVGTIGRTLPYGLAMKAERGSQIILNLHLFNVTDAPLRGRSGSLIGTVDPSQVTTFADGVVAGPVKLTVPPGRSVQTGACTVDHDYSVFSIFPHMHELGRHMKVVAKRAAGDDVVLFDGPYDFTHQSFYRIDPPLELATGDRIELACTYDNTTGRVVHFGESTKDEMCQAGLGRFPAGGLFACPY